MIYEKFVEKLVCPITGQKLSLRENALVTEDGERRYPIDDGVARLFVTEGGNAVRRNVSAPETTIALSVQDFYQDSPFPDYNGFETIADFVREAERGIFAKLLSDQIPMNANILEVGCGTGQLSNCLAATCMARVWASDMTMASLRLGQQFAAANGIRGISFIQMNLFYPCVAPESMDIVISNGVLHHTHNTKVAFTSIARLVKPGGFILVGLYNRIGRLRTDFRRVLYRFFGEKALFLDPHLRKNLFPAKRRAWLRDQYLHPSERKHTMSEVLKWFEEGNFEFINSIPKIVGHFSSDEKLFQKNSHGTAADRLQAELLILFTRHGGEGGIFIMIGRKK